MMNSSTETKENLIMRGIAEESIYLFGAGLNGEKCCRILKELGIEAKGFVDNDGRKQGEVVLGLPVLSLKAVLKLDSESFFVITISNCENSIKNQLLSEGVDNKRIISMYDLYDSEWINNEINKCIVDEDKKHICFDYDNLNALSVFYDSQIFSIQKMGGVSRYFYEIADGISTYDNTIVTVLEGYSISNLSFNNRIRQPFCRKPDNRLLQESIIREKANKSLTEFYFSKIDTIDIYHPTYYEDYNLTKYKKKIITVHDMIHELFNMDVETINNKKRSILEADGIIAVSENTKKDLIEILKVPENRIRVIYHGNSLDYNVETESRIVDEPYLLYVGYRGEYKNFTCLVNAYVNCIYKNSVKLVCFGGSEFNEREMQFFDNRDVSGKVIHIDGDDRVLANLYRNAEIFVYPSLYEGFGIPLLEAMHYGTPVITSNVSSMPEIAGDAADYFNPESEEELRCRIERLLGDGDRRMHLREAGLKREKEFSWKKAVDETYQYYRDVLESQI